MGTTSIGQIPVLLRHRRFNAVYWCENQDVYELVVAKKAALTAGMVALLAPVTIGVIGGRIARAQSRMFVPRDSLSGGALMAAQTSAQSQGVPAPQFEVASIKPASPSAPQHGRLTRMEALIETGPGLITARNATLKELVEGAYSLEKYQVIGGPEWVDSVRFEVQGKAAGAASRQQLLLMLRPLLAERFRLAFHSDTKELMVYALVVAKGAKLKMYQGAEGAPLGVNRLGRNVSMADFAKYLTRLGNDLPVIDKTGLTGKYDLDLDMNKIIAAAGADSGNPSISSVFQATVDAIEGLGLRLVRTKDPVEALVLDHAERPSPN
jgi:uncharacterized protein (TIGR03435 family)